MDEYGLLVMDGIDILDGWYGWMIWMDEYWLMAMDALEDGRFYCPSKETKTHPKKKHTHRD